MDSSKFGWRAPSEPCLDEISRRWPDQVQVVVDACQMRLGRTRLRNYLDRGYLVLITGSKFFTGPPFSGALLAPSGLARGFDTAGDIAPGLLEYTSRSDWPKNWPVLRSRFPVRANFGQWLRWEAALEEIRAYYAVPDEFRLTALTSFGEGVEWIVASSPSLRLLPPQQRLGGERLGGNRLGGEGSDDDEFSQRTIFPFVIRRGDRMLSLEACKKLYRALARDAVDVASAGAPAAVAAKPCLIGQPVALGRGEGQPIAALRICAGARLVTEAWSPDADIARGNLQRELGHVGTVVAKIEWLLAQMDNSDLAEVCHGA
jgi:hypothetical protein